MPQPPHSPSPLRAALHWTPAVLWAGFIFFLSHRTPAELPDVSWAPPGFDKAAHAGVYAILGGLLAWAFAGASPLAGRGRGRIIGAAVALGLAYGGLDELHQAFVPQRSPDVLDLVADAMGLALGAWFTYNIFIRSRLSWGGHSTHKRNRH